MVSNGLSRRREVLKRPIVCKSKKPGYCGACTFDTDFPSGTSVPVGGQLPVDLLLTCDPKPSVLIYAVLIRGAFTIVEPDPEITVGVTKRFTLQAPTTEGTYLVYLTVVNKNKCHETVENSLDTFVP
jgi:hypothetical protein